MQKGTWKNFYCLPISPPFCPGHSYSQPALLRSNDESPAIWWGPLLAGFVPQQPVVAICNDSVISGKIPNCSNVYYLVLLSSSQPARSSQESDDGTANVADQKLVIRRWNNHIHEWVSHIILPPKLFGQMIIKTEN